MSRGLCGVLAPDGAGAPVVLVASVVCGRCGGWAVAWGVEVDGLEDVEVVGLPGALVADGAKERTLVALVAAVPSRIGYFDLHVDHPTASGQFHSFPGMPTR